MLLLVAAWHDIHTRRIPNALVFSGALAGMGLNALLPQEMGGLGIADSLAGIGVGLVLLLPFYLLRVMAAGDIKLMAMTGTFLGAGGTMDAVLCVLLAGGVLALGTAWHRGKLHRLLHNLKRLVFAGAVVGSRASFFLRNPISATDATESVGNLPYGVAIASGTVAYLAIAHWG
ncbi:MAG: A24 family peptidase [Nitrosospira sp.]